jgi:hypothetical protein
MHIVFIYSLTYIINFYQYLSQYSIRSMHTFHEQMLSQLLQLVYQLTFECGILRVLVQLVTNKSLFCAYDSPKILLLSNLFEMLWITLRRMKMRWY